MPFDVVRFRESMQRVAAAVTVIATETDGVRAGLTASAVTSLTAEPPTLLACVNRDAGSHGMLMETGRFSVNVLARDQEEIAEAFAGFTGLEGAERFEVGEWSEGQLGVPILAGALVSFECRLQACYSQSTHDILVGAIDHSHVSEGPIEPLLYVDRTFGGFTA